VTASSRGTGGGGAAAAHWRIAAQSVAPETRNMVMEILSRTPVWVWGLLAALLAWGIAQSRDRLVAPSRLLLLPIVLLALGLSSMAAGFVALPAAAALWLAALAGGATWSAGRAVRRGTQWRPDTRRLQLPGSWLPMLLIVVIFSLRYITSVGMAINPAWRTAPGVLLPLALLYGGLSGLFIGRALVLLRLTRTPRLANAHVGAA
jgi:hypothetical protein